MAIGIGLLGLYAASRVKAGNDLREKEKLRNTPVSYSMGENGKIEEYDPAKHNQVDFYKFGDTFKEAQGKFEPFVLNEMGMPTTVSQYRSSRVNEDDPDPAGIRVPQLQGLINTRTGDMKQIPGQKVKATGSTTKVYGIINGKMTNKYDNDSEYVAVHKQLPTLSVNVNTDGSFVGTPQTIKYTNEVKDGTPFKGFRSTPLIIKVTDKKGTESQVPVTFSSANTSIPSQILDVHSQVLKYKDVFAEKNMGDVDVKDLVSSLVPLAVSDATKVYDTQGKEQKTMKKFIDANNYLKTYAGFSNIPGFDIQFKYALGLVRKKWVDNQYKLTKQNNEANGETDKTSLIGKTKDNDGDDIYFEIPSYKKYNKAMEVIKADFSMGMGDDEEKNANIEPLVSYVYEKDKFGLEVRIATNPDGTRKLAAPEKQHPLNFITKLLNSKAATGNQYGVFKAILLPNENPYADEKDKKIVRRDYTRFVMRQGGYLDGHSLIMGFISGGETDDDTLNKAEARVYELNKAYFPTELQGKSAQDYLVGAVTTRDSAGSSLGTLRRLESTFYDYQGNELGISTFEGDIILGVDGIIYLGNKFINAAGNLVRDLPGSGKFGGVPEGKKMLLRELDEQVAMNGLIGSFKRSEQRKDDSLHEKRQREFKEIFNDLKLEGNDKATVIARNLAQRRYYKMMVAYQLAAAMQGGTGGRTISDQDVDNILKALGNDKLSTPAKELAGIRAAIDLMQEIYSFNKHLAGSPNERYAALKHQEMIAESDFKGRNPLRMDGLDAAIYIARATDNKAFLNTYNVKDINKETTVSPANSLKAYNDRARLTGSPVYNSVEEANKAGIDLNQFATRNVRKP